MLDTTDSQGMDNGRCPAAIRIVPSDQLWALAGSKDGSKPCTQSGCLDMAPRLVLNFEDLDLIILEPG